MRHIARLLDNWLVFWLLVFLVIGWTFWLINSAHAVNYTFAGLLADGGTITGAFAYDEAWNVTSSAFDITPVMTKFHPVVGAVLTTLCTANCIFGSPNYALLTIMGLDSTGLSTRTRLAFEGILSGPLEPRGSDWITTYADGSRLGLGVNSGTLTPSVPEPGSWWGLMIGMVGVGAYLWKR